MFMSDKSTLVDCLGRNIFGLPRNMLNKMDNIGDNTLLFLANKDSKEVFGIFRPLGRPALNIDPTAYAPLSFPAQIQIQRTSVDSKVPRASLSWPVRFGPLAEAQVEELQAAFAAAVANPAPAAAATALPPPPPPPRASVSAAAAPLRAFAPAAAAPAFVPAASAGYRRKPGSAAAAAEDDGSGAVALSVAAAMANLALLDGAHGRRSDSHLGRGGGKGGKGGKGSSSARSSPSGPSVGGRNGNRFLPAASCPASGPAANAVDLPPLPPDVAVLDLCVRRLELEAQSLKGERRALGGSPSLSDGPGGGSESGASNQRAMGLPPPWPARYAQLSDRLGAAVAARDFVAAASFKQQVKSRKGRLAASR
jgi:hypothetical protein